MINRIESLRQKLLKEGKKIINLSSGNTNEHGINFPTSILKKSLQSFWKKSGYHPDPKGLLEARKTVALFYKERGWIVNPDQIVLTSGTSESYFHIFKLLTQDTDTLFKTKILLPFPGYPLFEEIARLAGVGFCFYRLQENAGWQIDLEDMEKQIIENKPKAIVIVSPHNPTGSVLGSQNLLEVIKLAQKYSLPIISDEVFSEYMFDRKSFPCVAELTKNVTIFTLNGVSKTYCLPGLKLSWVVVSGPQENEIMEELERSADTFLATNVMSQSMLPTIFKDGKNFLKKTQKLIEQNRNIAVKILSKTPTVSFHKPEGGFYLFLKINGLKMTDEEFALELLEKTGIFVHPGYFYDFDEGVYVVISLAFKKDFFLKYLHEIVGFIKQK